MKSAGMVLAGLGFFLLLSACNSEHLEVQPSGAIGSGNVGAHATGGGPGSQIGYDNVIRPLFEKRCALCHNSSSAIPDWLVYATAFQYRSEIYQKVVTEKSMPLNNVTGMTEDERQIVAEWINAGAPEQGSSNGAPEGSTPPPGNSVGPSPTPSQNPAAPGGTPTPTPSSKPSSTPSAGPDVGNGTSDGVTYIGTVLPIFQNRCAICHNSSSSVPNWLSYPIAYQYRSEIYQKVVVDKTMPLGNATGMTDEERQIVGEWVQAGAPEGGTVSPPASAAPSGSVPSPDGAGLSEKGSSPGDSGVVYPPLTRCFHRLTPDLTAASAAGNDQQVRHLLNLGACVNDRREGSGQSALLSALNSFSKAQAMEPRYLATVKDLIAGGADVNARLGDGASQVTGGTDPMHGRSGYTALMIAVTDSSVSLVKALVAAKARVDLTLPDGTGPLTLACEIQDPTQRAAMVGALAPGNNDISSLCEEIHHLVALDSKV